MKNPQCWFMLAGLMCGVLSVSDTRHDQELHFYNAGLECLMYLYVLWFAVVSDNVKTGIDLLKLAQKLSYLLLNLLWRHRTKISRMFCFSRMQSF